MATAYNEVNYSFIVQITTLRGHHYDYLRIDQNVGNRRHASNVQRVTNTVERHLDGLSKRNQMAYHVIYAGNPEMATAILEAENDCPF